MKTLAEQKLEFINTALQQGKTVFISTAYRTTKITPKTAKKFEDANIELFKIDSVGDLCIRAGKRYNCFCTKNVLLTGLYTQ